MMSEFVQRHIALHRAMGRLYGRQAEILRSFGYYADARDEDIIRSSTALAWAAQGKTPSARYIRLQTIRRFARLTRTEDPRHEIPPAGIFGPRPVVRAPYIYTPEEIAAVLRVAALLGPPGSLRPKMYVMLFGLLASTGMRISEALSLRLGDITEDGLVVRQSKFHKSRLVPLHPSVMQKLEEYLTVRSKHSGKNDAVFISNRCNPIRPPAACEVFLALIRRLGIRPGPGKQGPRMHDLRHTFAVRALERCVGGYDDIQRHMLALSTYLGHAGVDTTYWYLHATPRLLIGIADRTESHSLREVE